MAGPQLILVVFWLRLMAFILRAAYCTVSPSSSDPHCITAVALLLLLLYAPCYQKETARLPGKSTHSTHSVHAHFCRHNKVQQMSLSVVCRCQEKKRGHGLWLSGDQHVSMQLLPRYCVWQQKLQVVICNPWKPYHASMSSLCRRAWHVGHVPLKQQASQSASM